MIADVFRRLAACSFPIAAAFLKRRGRSACCLTLALLFALGPVPSRGQTAAVAQASVATNVPPAKPADSVNHAKISRWKPIFRGVEMCEGTSQIPRPLRVHAVRVDLREPTIDFLVTPRIGNGTNAWGGRTTSEFLSEFKCQVAINGSFFDVFAKHRGDPMHVEGLSVSRGNVYISRHSRDALLISTNHRAWIVQSPREADGAYNAVSGYRCLLIDGKNNGTMIPRHPRSAVGVSRNGRYLILMAIDGRQPDYSEGVGTAEAAEWMRKLGAYNALNLDGGGSTALVIEGPNGAPEALNRPCGPPVGVQRRVANHLGVYAQKLSGSKTAP